MGRHQLQLGEFYDAVSEILLAYDLTGESLKFSNAALSRAAAGDFELSAEEFVLGVSKILEGKLAHHHVFLAKPYVRRFEFPRGEGLSVAIINQQSRDWYGGGDSVGAFDFLYEKQLGVFDGCNRFLDLGGHQLVWSCYYASLHSAASVVAFEPSLVNVLIGLYNCLLNGVVDRVRVVPYAVAVGTTTDAASRADETSKMLVDYMTIPLRTCSLDQFCQVFDFVKTDIEGYEYELLKDDTYRKIVGTTKFAHFELHLGHLVKRGISRDSCVSALNAAGINGVELYSRRDMYVFLQDCDPAGYYSFLLGAGKSAS